MKKGFIVVLLFCSFFVFADTGYRGTEWYSEEKDILDKIDLYSALDKEVEKVLGLENYMRIDNESKAILGDLNEVSYFFSKDEYFIPRNIDDEKFRLIGIAYITSVENLLRLRNSFNKLVQQYIEVRSDYKEIVETELQGTLDFKELSSNIIDTIIKAVLVGISVQYEKQGEYSFSSGGLVPDKDSTEKDGTLYIYDFNDDTRVFIYDNIIKDKLVVVYVPHEQDY